VHANVNLQNLMKKSLVFLDSNVFVYLALSSRNNKWLVSTMAMQ